MKIDRKQLLTPEMCMVTKDRLFNLRQYWIDRCNFHTLGASAYLDDPIAYPGIAANCNIIIDGNFPHLKVLIANYFKETMSREVVVMPNLGLPGLHIFGEASNDITPSIHTDEPYERIDWPCGHTDPFSFTLPIELPKAGGGLDWWDNQEHQETAPPYYEEYKLGEMLIYSGESLHRIARPEPLGETDWRITYQGHGLILDTGNVVIYF